jgi:hypothetical protein
MSFILVSGQKVTVLFKAHYMTKEATFFASKAYGNTGPTQNQALDFFKEFCNLTAGFLKLTLASSKVSVGISLPIMARGFDEIFYPKTPDMVKSSWGLTCEDQTVYCSTNLTLRESFPIKIKNIHENASTGDVEFL